MRRGAGGSAAGSQGDAIAGSDRSSAASIVARVGAGVAERPGPGSRPTVPLRGSRTAFPIADQHRGGAGATIAKTGRSDLVPRCQGSAPQCGQARSGNCGVDSISTKSRFDLLLHTRQWHGVRSRVDCGSPRRTRLRFDRHARAPERCRRVDADQLGRPRHRVDDINPGGELKMPIRVILADDHLIVRQGLRLMLEKEHIEVLGEASDGLEAIRMIRELLPEIAVLDLDMPGVDGLSVLREAARISPRTRTIILTRHMEEPYAVEALRIGARGYVLKTQASTDLVAAIRHVDRGEVYLSPKISNAVVQAFLTNPDAPNGKLSLRERQVLQLIGEGHTTKKIAALLGISTNTADSHRTKVMEKLDIHQTAGLVRYAIRNGLIEP